MAKSRKPAAPAAAASAPSPAVRAWTAFLIAAPLVAYAAALHGGFLWDDDVYVSHNLLLTAPDGLRRIWFSLDSPSQYFPLTYTTFLLERGIWGLNTFGYHLVNVLLHAANALLVWRILEDLEIPGAWLAAGVFALHPVQVESVAWITERKNVLSALFYLLSLRSWVRSLDATPTRRAAAVAAALIFYLLALFSKTTACTLPAALVLAVWLKGRAVDRRRALEVGAFVGLGVAMGLLTVWWEKHQQGAGGGPFRLTPAQAVIAAGRALWFYAGKLAWPSGLSFSYARWTVRPEDWRQWLWPGCAALLFAVLGEAWRRGRPAAAYAALFFAATLSPLLGFIPLYTFRYSYVADHYQYLACVGPISLAAAAAARGLWPDDPRTPRLHAAVIVLFGALILATSNRAAAFADSDVLWRDTLEKNPGSWLAYNNLGCSAVDRGDWAQAETDFKRAISLGPDEYRNFFDLGALYEKQGRRDDALASYEEALRLEPAHGKSLLSAARLHAQAGRDDQAVEFYRRGLAADPEHPEARNSLGMILARQGRTLDAVEEYRRALELNPRSFTAHNNLANAYLRLNRDEEAVAEYRSALELNANFPAAHFNLGVALAKRGKLDEAAAQYEAALAQQPDLAAARRNLESLKAASGVAGERKRR